MSEYTAASAGIAALEAKDWDAAISKLTEALRSARSPKWLIARSRAHVGRGDFRRALRDAEYAHLAAAARGNRDLIREAQHRRAVAHFRLAEYGNAEACARWAQGLVEGKSSADPGFRDPVVDARGFAVATRAQLEAGMRLAEEERRARDGGFAGDRSPAGLNAACALRLQILGQLDKLAADDEKRRVTVAFAPAASLDDFEASEQSAPEKKKVEKEDAEEAKAAAAESVRKAPAQTDVRVDFFQSNAVVSVSVFAKGVPKEEFKAEYGDSEVRMSHIPGHEPWFTLPLWGAIDPEGSKHTVTANKVEFHLKKAKAAKWPTLRRDPSVVAGPTEVSEPTGAPAAAASAAATAPSYPKSSKSGAKNWDTVLADEKDEDDKDINVFFKSLYKDATPEQQRAMMKSFTESNGTALSTDWDDVKNRTVETQPPEGVEAKRWDF